MTEHGLDLANVVAVFTCGKWWRVKACELATVRIGRHAGDRFMSDRTLDDMLYVETAEDESIYFPVNSVTGIMHSTPFGG